MRIPASIVATCICQTINHSIQVKHVDKDPCSIFIEGCNHPLHRVISTTRFIMAGCSSQAVTLSCSALSAHLHIMLIHTLSACSMYSPLTLKRRLLMANISSTWHLLLTRHP